MTENATQISRPLLRYLRDQLADGSVEFRAPPTPLLGGFDTAMYRFELARPVKAVPSSLVLRVYPRDHGTEKPVMESTVQNALAAAGQATPRALFVCIDASVLGGAFIVMEFLPGKPLMEAPMQTSDGVLGQAHAELHRLDSRPVIEALRELGIDHYRLDNRLAWLEHAALELPEIRGALDWVVGSAPREPDPLALCHGDFHKRNILFDGEKVTGLLDWSAFTLTDPSFDVAGTLMLFDIHTRRQMELGEFEPQDVDAMIERYLAGYRSRRALDDAKLEYFGALRCLIALVHGLRGRGVSSVPAIARDLKQRVEAVTGSKIPDSQNAG